MNTVDESIERCDDIGQFCVYLEAIIEKAKTIDAPSGYLRLKAHELGMIANKRMFTNAISFLRKEYGVPDIRLIFQYYLEDQEKLNQVISESESKW